MGHEESYTSLDTSTHEVAEDDEGFPRCSLSSLDALYAKLNRFGSVTSVVIMADGSTL